MKVQKAILLKYIRNDIPAFVIAGHDLFAVPTMEAYYQAAKETGWILNFKGHESSLTGNEGFLIKYVHFFCDLRAVIYDNLGCFYFL